MNNYTQKVDKVGTDEVFPYPIKLEHDSENFYITVLKYPKPEECKLSPYIMQGVEKGLYNLNSTFYEYLEVPDVSNYLTYKRDMYYGYLGNFYNGLYLCIEVKSTDSERKGKGYYRKHSSKSKRFIVRLQSPIILLDSITINNPVTIPIRDCLNRVNRIHSNSNIQGSGVFRATIRFSRRHTNTIIKNRESLRLERTGIYSNTVKILD